MQRTYQFADSGERADEERLVARLMAAGVRRKFRDGQLIHQQGDVSQGFWIVAQGAVMLGKSDAGGGNTAYAVLGKGDLFGELAYFGGVERQVDATARGDAELVWLSDAVVAPLLAAEPPVAMLLLRSLARQLQSALLVIDERRRLITPVRLARLLIDLVDEDGRTVRATQQELADLLGVSRVALVAALGRLARSGAIARGYRVVTIHDCTALGKLASQEWQ